MKTLFFTLVFLLPILAYGKVTHSSTISYPFYSEDKSGNSQMMPLHRNEESFQLRLELIRKAQKTIEVEYYIYEMDMVGKIFTRELVQAAERGVKIRILIDKFAGKVSPYLAHELIQKGIEVKFYNTNLVLKLNRINFRNHRKLLVIDGVEAITGGRNLADDYYGSHEKFNYEDRDVYVKGPMVGPMRDSFNEFYNHRFSHVQERKERPSLRNDGSGEGRQRRWDKNVKAAQDFLKESEEELALREHYEIKGNAQLEDNNLYNCPVATFVTDAPGKSSNTDEYQANNRNVRKTFLDKILPIDKAITLSTPYFIPNDRNEFMFEELLKKGVDFNLYTNSLRSTDSILISARLYVHLKGWLKKGMKVSFHDGDFTGLGSPYESAQKSNWATHAKTHVYETSTYTEVMIGSYNVDNRSDFYNAEIAVFCKGNDDFTANVKGNILAKVDRGFKATGLTHAIDRNGKSVNITGASPFKQLKMKILNLPSWLMSDLL